jgi:hypothetical protein
MHVLQVHHLVITLAQSECDRDMIASLVMYGVQVPVQVESHLVLMLGSLSMTRGSALLPMMFCLNWQFLFM